MTASYEDLLNAGAAELPAGYFYRVKPLDGPLGMWQMRIDIMRERTPNVLERAAHRITFGRWFRRPASRVGGGTYKVTPFYTSEEWMLGLSPIELLANRCARAYADMHTSIEEREREDAIAALRGDYP